MRVPTTFACVLAAALLLAAPTTGATVTDGTFWTCSTRETLKISRLPKQVDEYSGIDLSFDEAGDFSLYLPGPDEFYGGTTVAKGKTGFLATPDSTSVTDLRNYVEDLVLDATGAEAVEITAFTWSVKGKVREGVLRAVLKAKGKGTITLGGKTRKGAGKLTEVLTSESE